MIAYKENSRYWGTGSDSTAFTANICDTWWSNNVVTTSADNYTGLWTELKSTTSTAIDYDFDWNNYVKAFEYKYRWLAENTVVFDFDPKSRIKRIIQQRYAPAIRTRRHLSIADDEREGRARETLLKVIGKNKFKNFIKNGFISVRAKSGLMYQIFTGHGITNVYRDGVMVERLCVVLKGGFPPTDSLIMRYLLILNDEQDFRNHAVEHRITSPTNSQSPVDERSLMEIYEEIKAA